MKRLLLAPMVLVIISASGCTKVDQSKARVLAAIDRTEQVSREFAYNENAGGHRTEVKGIVQDDLRYAVSASLDGSPAASEIVTDDARALQVTNARLLSAIVAPAPAPAAGAGTAALPGAPAGLTAHVAPSPAATASASPSSSPNPIAIAAGLGPQAATAPAPVPDALKSGSWVVDKSGAATIAAANADPQKVGRNPLLDSLTVLEYVRAAADVAEVVKYNPDGETYRPKLDFFPRPTGGVLRYDLVPPALRAKSNNAGRVQVDVPDSSFFRLMAIYIRDGRVVDVREKIDILARLQDTQSNLAARLKDFVYVPNGASTQAQARLLQASLNHQLALQNKAPVRLRDMHVAFTNLGHASLVSLPDGAAEGDLSGVGAHAQLLYEHR